MKILKHRCLAIMIAAATLLLSPGAHAGPVDINTADAATLADALNGVGEKKAATIVAHREAHGPFRSVEDLAEVQGIGNGTVEKNRANIVIGQPPAE